MILQRNSQSFHHQLIVPIEHHDSLLLESLYHPDTLDLQQLALHGGHLLLGLLVLASLHLCLLDLPLQQPPFSMSVRESTMILRPNAENVLYPPKRIPEDTCLFQLLVDFWGKFCFQVEHLLYCLAPLVFMGAKVPVGGSDITIYSSPDQINTLISLPAGSSSPTGRTRGSNSEQASTPAQSLPGSSLQVRTSRQPSPNTNLTCK